MFITCDDERGSFPTLAVGSGQVEGAAEAVDIEGQGLEHSHHLDNERYGNEISLKDMEESGIGGQ